ncbi:AbiJ-NTD4 domain-containing protein [Sphingobacterium corticis]|uniref:AbiJ-NTD4 domain-containing protein n=1 Tax=Sphingobacterium corticis TaxID=1812823 RepID=A0ABW5NHZ2_9SPHI
MRFSQRFGMTSVRDTIQIDDIDDALRNRLWNLFLMAYWNNVRHELSDCRPEFRNLMFHIWVDLFNNRYDELARDTYRLKHKLKEFFFETEWFNVYDFIEFLPQHYGDRLEIPTNEVFVSECNIALEKCMSGYRFINFELAPITSVEEINTIEEAINDNKFNGVKVHLKSALSMLSDRENPDYRNSIKESISAVESYCKASTGDTKAMLGASLNALSKKIDLHPALNSAFQKLYAYTSDEKGIRHALMDKDVLSQEDAQFMLVSCSAFINYLQIKESKV